ncbi:MAG: ligase-associated DNA damage response exonuclease [Ignavibacteria bacterium]
MKTGLLKYTKKGLYCPQADIYIDPWGNVDKAVITHAHSDHARRCAKSFIAHFLSVPIMKQRLGSDINVKGIDYRKVININGVKVSLHPAGHIPGSAQVRLEHKGEITVISGDYKVVDDGLSEAFEPVKCHTFVTESTFGLPIYKWKPQQEIYDDINNWWRRNKAKRKTTVICGYSLGKAQRILYHLDPSIGKIFTHGAIENVNRVFREQGLQIPLTTLVTKEHTKKDFPGNLVIAPSSAAGNGWLNKFEPYSIGNASGWMNVRGAKRWQAIDMGFALSDHADWTGLNSAIKETGAETIYVTHGFTAVFVKWLREKGYDAHELHTQFTGEQTGSDEEFKEQ